MAMNMALEGLEDLRKTFSTLKDKTAKKVARAGLMGGLEEIAKQIKSGVNGSSMSTDAKQAARLTVGKSIKKDDGENIGKAGFGVGKRSGSKMGKAAERHGDKRGVGISANNIQWFLGTQQRQTGAKTLGRGAKRHKVDTGNSIHKTGAMPDLLDGIIDRAVSGSEDAIVAATAAKAKRVMESEANTVKKG